MDKLNFSKLPKIKKFLFLRKFIRDDIENDIIYNVIKDYSLVLSISKTVSIFEYLPDNCKHYDEKIIDKLLNVKRDDILILVEYDFLDNKYKLDKLLETNLSVFVIVEHFMNKNTMKKFDYICRKSDSNFICTNKDKTYSYTNNISLDELKERCNKFKWPYY